MPICNFAVICTGERTGRVLVDDGCHNIHTAQEVAKRFKKLGYKVGIYDNRRGSFIHMHPVFGAVR